MQETTTIAAFEESPVSTQQPGEDNDEMVHSNSQLILGLSIAIGCFGILSNVLVLIVVLCSKKLRDFSKLTNLYIFNQTCLDVTVAIFLVLLTVFEERDEHLLKGTLGDIYCRIWLHKVPLWATFVSSSFNLVMLNIERYFAILHPVWHKLHFTKRVGSVSLIFIWLIGPIILLAYVLPVSFVTDGKCYIFVGWNLVTQRFLGILTATIQFLVPIFIHAFVCIKIVKFLHSRANAVHDNRHTNQQPSSSTHPSSGQISSSANQSNGGGKSAHKENNVPSNPGRGGTQVVVDKKAENAIHARNQALKTLALMTISFVVCWIWNQVYFLLYNFGFPLSLSGPFYQFTILAIYINCFTNPFIYISQYKFFRDEARDLVCRRLA